MRERFVLPLSRALVLSTAMVVLAAGARADKAVVFQAAGADAGAIRKTVDDFKKALGRLNPSDPGSRGEGRREVDWDQVPDAAADSNPFPGDFLNVPVPGRAAGIVLSTPGRKLLVSSDRTNPTRTPVAFGRIDRAYPRQLATFSPERLLAAVGRKNVVDVTFFVPGSFTRAATTGFGVVLADVDLPLSTRLDCYDREDNLIFRMWAPPHRGAGGFSFAGVTFRLPVVWRVRLINGTTGPGFPDAPGRGADVVVMDDVIYGEPR